MLSAGGAVSAHGRVENATSGVADAHGGLTFDVRRGTYVIFVQFVTRANERDIPVDTTLTKRAHFKVVADYRR